MRFARLIAAAALVATAACGSDSGGITPTTVAFTGTYVLKTAGGQNLPFITVAASGVTQSLTADTLTVADNGSWTETRIIRTESSGQSSVATVHDGGSWIRSGNLLNLSSNVSGQAAYFGTFTGTQLNFSDYNVAYVFTR